MTLRLLVFLPALAAAQITSADLYKLRSATGAEISPDGARIAYTVSLSDQPGRPYSETWILPLATRQPLKLGRASGPRWSPDGQRLAYMGADGLSVARADGSGATVLAQVTGTNHPLPGSGERLTWSPDGKQIAFVSATPGPEKGFDGDPMVITRYLYKPTASEGMTRFNDNRRMHIFVVDVTTQAVRQLTSGDFYEHSIDWSPRGDEILFISNREPDPDRVFNYDIFAIPAAGGSIRRLTNTKNAEYRPVWSPDGRTIAYLGTKRPLTSSETTMEDTHVWLMNADGSNRRELGGVIDNRQGAPEWAADGSAVYFAVQERGSSRLYRLPVSGGPARAITPDRGSVGAWSLDKNGSIAYAWTTRAGPAELNLQRGAAAPDQLTSLNRELLGSRRIAEVENFTFKSVDGLEIEAFLTKPLGLTASPRHPLIVMIHGGPHGQQGPGFNSKAQIYAARGFAGLMVNYRGSTGYGQKLADAIFKDQNGKEAEDVLAGVDAARARYPWIDRERMGIEGGSYGGQLTNWLVTRTDRFRAAIPLAGISNLITLNYLSYYHDYLAVEFGAFPHEGKLMDLLWERSPLRYVARVKTPVLLVHGENDNDVPIAEAEQFSIALKDVGVETVMLRYPREGHGLRETRHIADLVERSIAWYERHFEKGGRK